MAASKPKLSPALDALIGKGLFDRLPVTFSTFFYEQIQEWDLLFPAEKSYYERLFDLLDRSGTDEVDRLFQDVRTAESKMAITDAIWPKHTFSLQQVDFLNRSPHYPEWRKAISGVFAQVDAILDQELTRHGRPRLVIVLSPAEMPVGPDRLWLRIAEHGKRVPVETSDNGPDLMTLAASIGDRFMAGKNAPAYGAWCVETGDRLASSSKHAGVVRLSYQRLADYRARLMKEVQQMVDAEQIRGPHQLSARLKQMKISAAESDLGKDAVLAEFARAVLLAGNGTLLINNTFVEWASIQAIRRARPVVTVISYGIRNKVKPFSSLLIYADQDASNPIPTQADMLGSYIDLEMFHQYIWQEFMKYAEYRGNTAFLFMAEGTDELLAMGPADFPLMSVTEPQKLDRVFGVVKDWVA